MAKGSSSDEKTIKVLNAIFILNAAQCGMSGGEIRKVLGVGMNEVTPVLKAYNKAKKARPAERADR